MKNLFILLLSLVASGLYSQDIIQLRSGKKMQVYVVGVKDQVVTYRKDARMDADQEELSLDKVSSIEYQSGKTDFFSNASDQSIGMVNESEVVPSDLGRNIIALATLDFFTQNVTLSYERIFGKKGKLGLRVPVSFNLLGTSLEEGNGFSNSPSLFYSGIDVNYYPLGQRQASFFLGPVIRAGQTRKLEAFYPGWGIPNYSLRRNEYITLLLQFGFSYSPVKELNFQTVVGIGTRRYFTSAPSNGSLVETRGLLNLIVGYRF